LVPATDSYASRSGRVGAQTESYSLTSFDGFGLDEAIARVIDRGMTKEETCDPAKARLIFHDGTHGPDAVPVRRSEMTSAGGRSATLKAPADNDNDVGAGHAHANIHFQIRTKA
jgi:hypothetical protein